MILFMDSNLDEQHCQGMNLGGRGAVIEVWMWARNENAQKVFGIKRRRNNLCKEKMGIGQGSG